MSKGTIKFKEASEVLSCRLSKLNGLGSCFVHRYCHAARKKVFPELLQQGWKQRILQNVILLWIINRNLLIRKGCPHTVAKHASNEFNYRWCSESWRCVKCWMTLWATELLHNNLGFKTSLRPQWPWRERGKTGRKK